MGSRGKVWRPCSAKRAECERDQFLIKSQASRFQKNHDQPADRLSVRFPFVESLTFRWESATTACSPWRGRAAKTAAVTQTILSVCFEHRNAEQARCLL